MNKTDLIKFITENQGEPLQDFYDKMYEKLQLLNKKIDKLTFYLIVIIALYLITSKAGVSSFQIGPITFSDISIIPKLLPILFSAILFDLIITSAHKSEIYTTVKFIFLSIYKQEINAKDLEDGTNSLFTRIFLPFSYTTELSRINSSTGCVLGAFLGILLVLPLFVIVLMPFYFQCYMIYDLFAKYYNDTLGKICFWISIWLSASTIFYFSNNFYKNFRDAKSGKL
jgi:hypothetical protein